MEHIADIRAALLGWFDAQQRDLPWRQTQDPYAIWLSEIMLQQTRVETVKPYYAAFLEAYPDVEAMAAAPQSEVLALWSGLGYYRRARNLHKAAQDIVKRFNGYFPSTHEEILSLSGVGYYRRARNLHKAAQDIVKRFNGYFPSTHEEILSLSGVGRYTAGAIASIAFALPYAAVDGNVHRVMARMFGIEQARGSTQLDKESWVWAEQLVEGERPGDLNQALMELGALVCTPRSPTCMLCPVRAWCQEYEAGTPDRLPLPKAKKPIKELEVLWALLCRRGKVLLVKRPEEGLFAGMWELPGCYLDAPSEAPLETLRSHLATLGFTASLDDAPQPYTHVLTHRRLSISVYPCQRLRGSVQRPRSQWRWVDPLDLPRLALSSITQTILDELGQDSP